MTYDIAQRVTDEIIARLETVDPNDWRCPWNRRNLGLPKNATTGVAYGGMNTILLWLTAQARGYTNDHWITLKQLSEVGGRLKPEVLDRPKGQKGATMCIRYGHYEKRSAPWTDATGDVHDREKVPFLKTFWVFNVEETEGLDPEFYTGDLRPDYGESTRQEIRDFVLKIGANVDHGGDRACYHRLQDLIRMPYLSRFIEGSGEKEGPQHYDATLLHEILHWTGHEGRMNRDTLVKLGTKQDYAREELCAEFGAAMLCAVFNVQGELRHAEYIRGWLQLLKADKYAVFRATRDARRALDWLAERAGLTEAVITPRLAAE